MAAMSQRGCPLCRTVAIDNRRLVDSFWREGRLDAAARRRFLAAGGFCREHAWLLHRLVAAQGAGAAIADLYGGLADRDLAWLEETKALLRTRRGRKGVRLRRRGRCPACRARDEASERKLIFFADALDEEEARDRYRGSDGVCFTHLSGAVSAALERGRRATAAFLIADWSARLAALRTDLAEFDRKRDYRYADEPKGDEQRSWTEVIRRYVGEDFAPDE